MNLNQAYKTLDLEKESNLETLKKTYRKMAFECHPDLNPEDPEAVKRFQRINDAYVTLAEHFKTKKKKADSSSKQKTRQKESEYYYNRKRTNNRFTEPNQSKHNKDKTNANKFSHAKTFQQYSYAKNNENVKGKSRLSQEEILKNIFNDPFARQVFEDIFKAIKNKKKQQRKYKGLDSTEKPSLNWINEKPKLDAIQLNLSKLKSWIRFQLDYTQTLYLPAQKLLPGSEIRFQFKAFKTPPRNITTHLPMDFQPGKPIRLKGLGRKLGPWQGDLYLRLIAK